MINDKHFQDIKYITNISDKYQITGGQLPSDDSMLQFLKTYQLVVTSRPEDKDIIMQLIKTIIK